MNKSNTRPLQAWEINAEWDCLCGVCGVDLGAECSGACDGEDCKCVCGECGDKDEENEDDYTCKGCKGVFNVYDEDHKGGICLDCGMCGAECGCICECGDKGEDFDVDDVDAPNTFPYKKCSVCEMRKSCGNYDEDKRWFCENCFVEEFGEEKEDEDYSKCLAGQCDEGHCKYEQCAECNVLMGGKCFHDEEEYDEHPDREDGYDAEGEWYCPKHQKKLVICKECDVIMNADGHRTYALPCGDFCKSCMEQRHSGCDVCNEVWGKEEEDEE